MLPKLEEMILLAVLKHDGAATAGAVQTALSDATGREHAFGSVFTTLDRLTDKRLLKWRKGDPDDRRGGRAPRLYTITASGKAELIGSLRATEALKAGTKLGPLVPVGHRS